MKKFNKNLTIAALAISLMFGFAGVKTALAAGPETVNLGTAGNFVVLSKTGISTTGATSVVGDIGVSPGAATLITGFDLILPADGAYSTSVLITGKVYAPGYANPTPANLTTAILDMQTAYTDAAGRAPTVTELGAGNIGGLTLAPGVYKWGTGLTIPSDVTLSGSANDVWIFQVAQNLNLSPAKQIILSGGANSANIFWQVAGQTTIGTTAVFNGNILGQTAIVLNTGATLNGRALAQTAVTLDANSVVAPSASVVIPTPVIVVTSTPAVTPTSTPVVTTTPDLVVTSTVPAVVIPVVSVSTTNLVSCTKELRMCPNGSSVGRSGPNCEFAICKEPSPTATSTTAITNNAAVSVVEPVKTITISLGKGNNGAEVETLQEFLISQNIGKAAQTLARVGATSYFGVLTRAALAEFQAKVGIAPAWGNFGPITRAYLSAHL